MNVPLIGILGWEASNQDTLSQLEQIPGNIAHPDTFSFPVLYKRVAGAYYQTVVVQPNAQVLAAMIATAQDMEQQGVKAIMINCGFSVIFQQEFADALNVPVFASSLLQVPFVHRMLKQNHKIGIVTADNRYLTQKHLEKAGITPAMPICIAGIEKTGEFAKIRADPQAQLDVPKFQQEIVQVARKLVIENPPVGAIVLECTDLPPCAAAIRRATGLPVFDIVTLAHMVYETIAGDRWAEHHPDVS